LNKKASRQYRFSSLASLLTGCFFLFCIIACKKKSANDPNSERVIARVYDRYLYADQVSAIVPPGASKADSLMLIRNYVQNWVRQQSVLKRAEDNLDEERKDVERQLEEYRNSLITYIYESELIRQKLDTAVSEQEIEQYYQEHQSSFQLKNNILQVNYFSIPKTAPKQDKVRGWFKSSQPKDKKNLEEYCYQFATNYYFNDEEWVLFDDLIKKVPVKTYDQEHFLRNNRYIEIPDSAVTFFVNIKGFKIKESLSPLSFERDNIRNLILNKRKLDLIKAMEKDAYDDAIQKKEIETWLPK
jgi:hypothetical protein